MQPTAREVRHLGGLTVREQSLSTELTLIGYAAKFNETTSIDGWFMETVAPGAFRESLRRGDDVRALLNHDRNHVLGRTTNGTLRLEEDTIGLRVEIDLLDCQASRDLYAKVKRGDITQMSFAFSTDKVSWILGRDGALDLRTLEAVTLYDVSPVTYPAYEGTEIAVRSRDAVRNRQEADTRACLARRLRYQELARREPK